jgi:predicted metal-binding membrane protein
MASHPLRRIAGALLIAAGLYQTTPVKRACLESCRSPMSFLMRAWRPSWAGAARLGLIHGLYCLGCCAVLMGLLFLFGVMNLVWVAALSLFVLVEKAFPFGQRVGLVAGFAAIALGGMMVAGKVHTAPDAPPMAVRQYLAGVLSLRLDGSGDRLKILASKA